MAGEKWMNEKNEVYAITEQAEAIAESIAKVVAAYYNSLAIEKVPEHIIEQLVIQYAEMFQAHLYRMAAQE